LEEFVLSLQRIVAGCRPVLECGRCQIAQGQGKRIAVNLQFAGCGYLFTQFIMDEIAAPDQVFDSEQGIQNQSRSFVLVAVDAVCCESPFSI